MNKRSKIPPLGWILALLFAAMGAMMALNPAGYYPSLKIETQSSINLLFINQSRTTRTECDTLLESVEKQILASCPQCTTSQRKCEETLPASKNVLFTDAPIAHPSAHLPSGVMVFESDNIKQALEACKTTVQAVNQTTKATSSVCYAPEAQREYFRAKSGWIDLRHVIYSLMAMLLAFFASKFTCYLIIRYEHLHAHLSHDQTDAGPQKFHAVPTPRVGGIPLMTGLVLATMLLFLLPNHFSDHVLGLLLLAGLPAFLGGITEDITKRVSVLQRLILTMLAGFLGSLILDATIPKFDVPGIDTLMAYTTIAIAVTLFAVGGIANAINIIDGYNGLASGFGIIASSCMALVAATHGDSLLMYGNLAMAGALFGFFVWNWPGGRIFLGDGGAYFLGFWLAEMAILLVVRNPVISPWFPLAIMIHPVFETVFSIYRRKYLHQTNPGHPDSAHLHQLIFKRLVRVHVGTKKPNQKTRRNSKVSPYFWVGTLAFSSIAVVFAQSSSALQLICLMFAVGYTLFYRLLLGWRIPEVLRTRG